MALIEYLRDQAETFRELARRETDPNIRRQLFSLAVRCDEVALAINEGPTFKRRQQG
jgi:hypothetical protein